ncbi:hypothetical protein Tco_0501828, partial [Tanacetum coccineum]
KVWIWKKGTECFSLHNTTMKCMLPEIKFVVAMLQPMPITALASALANAPPEQQSP